MRWAIIIPRSISFRRPSPTVRTVINIVNDLGLRAAWAKGQDDKSAWLHWCRLLSLSSFCHISPAMMIFAWRPAAGFLVYLSLALLVLSLPLAFLLPAWWSYENQPIENAQVILLGAGVVASGSFFAGEHGPGRWLGLAAALILLVLIGRELSWGAVFYDPTSMSGNGPIFASRKLWYRPVVVPVVAVVLLSSIAIIIAKRLVPLGICLLRQRRVPLIPVGLLVAGLLVSAVSEGHVLSAVMGAWGNDGAAQLLEELSELAAYIAMTASLFFVFSELSSRDTASFRR